MIAKDRKITETSESLTQAPRLSLSDIRAAAVGLREPTAPNRDESIHVEKTSVVERVSVSKSLKPPPPPTPPAPSLMRTSTLRTSSISSSANTTSPNKGNFAKFSMAIKRNYNFSDIDEDSAVYSNTNTWQKAVTRVADLVKAKTVFEWDADAGLSSVNQDVQKNRDMRARARSVFSRYGLDDLDESLNRPKSEKERKLEQAMKTTVHVDVWQSLDTVVPSKVDIQKTVQEKYDMDIINKGCELLEKYTKLNHKLDQLRTGGVGRNKKKALTASLIEAQIKPLFETKASGFRAPVIPKPTLSKLNVKSKSPEKEFKLGREIIWGALANSSGSEKLLDQERKDAYRLGKNIVDSKLT